ncbi:MAG: glycosyltransferase family 2 protein [Planctomycetota bacterium]
MTQEPTSPDSGPSRVIDLSIVVPIYNEVESLPPLVAAIETALARIGRTHEIILVDDGSSDGSRELLTRMVEVNPRLKVVLLSRNFGQTQAMAAGFDLCRGSTVVTMDGDLQNDPADIPGLLALLDEGYDIVCGWRRGRRDRALTRKLPSWIANRLIAVATGVNIHDTGCTLKAYRAWVVRSLHLYSDMHRFIPALAAGVGARVGELPVHHHPRRFGSSKYGIGRTLRVVTDMLLLRMIVRFAAHPVRYFGLASLPLFLLGGIFAFLGLVKFIRVGPGLFDTVIVMPAEWHLDYMTSAAVVFMTALNLFMLGLLSELSVSVSEYFSHAGFEVEEARGDRSGGREP